MAVKKSRKKIIIPIVVILVICLGVGAYFGVTTGFFTQKQSSENNINADTEYKKDFHKAESKVSELIGVGSKQSIDEADKIIDSEVDTANDSGNDLYIVDASLAKAALLIETNRAQEALDKVLTTLNKKYENNNEHKNDIYIHISLAYRELGDADMADKYLDQVTGVGGD